VAVVLVAPVAPVALAPVAPVAPVALAPVALAPVALAPVAVVAPVMASVLTPVVLAARRCTFLRKRHERPMARSSCRHRDVATGPWMADYHLKAKKGRPQCRAAWSDGPEKPKTPPGADPRPTRIER
jgi:hypothetical protein